MSEKSDNNPSASVEDRTKSPERTLSEREHLLRVLADHSPGHIAYVGADDLCYQFVNQKFESSFGRPREEIIGQHIEKIIGQSNYKFALKYIEAVRAGKPASYENVLIWNRVDAGSRLTTSRISMSRAMLKALSFLAMISPN